MTKPVFGPSTGETGQYGVGEIVKSTIDKVSYDGDFDCFMIDGEPVYEVYEIENGDIRLVMLSVREFR